jgi:hypothetical protein
MKFEMKLFYMLMRTFTRALDVSRLRCFPLSGIVRALRLLAIPFILCHVVAAQTPASGSGNVEGIVFVMDSGTVSPLAGAKVELKGSKTFRTESHPTGTFAFREVDLGPYTIKASFEDHLIVEIGKDLRGCYASDTGMFLYQPSLFLWLDSALTNGNYSLSDGLRLMGLSRAFRGFDIGDQSWQDFDTPEALDYAGEAVYAWPGSFLIDERPAHV